MLPDNYKQLREELDALLIELAVPKIYWHQLAELNVYLSRRPYFSRTNELQPKLFRAFDLIHEILPQRLTRLDKGENNVTNSL